MMREDLARVMINNMARDDTDSIEQLRQTGIRAVQTKFPAQSPNSPNDRCKADPALTAAHRNDQRSVSH